MKVKLLPKSKELIDEIAKELHGWYLEAAAKSPESFNPKAQVPFDKLTEEQKYVDRYIAEKVLNDIFDKVMFSCMRGYVDALDRMEKEGRIKIIRDAAPKKNPKGGGEK